MSYALLFPDKHSHSEHPRTHECEFLRPFLPSFCIRSKPRVGLTGVLSVLLLQIQMLGLRYFEALVSLLLALVAVAFFIEWGASNVPIADTVYHSLVPAISSTESLYIAVSLIGSVIMRAFRSFRVSPSFSFSVLSFAVSLALCM